VLVCFGCKCHPQRSAVASAIIAQITLPHSIHSRCIAMCAYRIFLLISWTSRTIFVTKCVNNANLALSALGNVGHCIIFNKQGSKRQGGVVLRLVTPVWGHSMTRRTPPPYGRRAFAAITAARRVVDAPCRVGGWDCARVDGFEAKRCWSSVASSGSR
jgi:hypothetical protein